MRKRKAPPAAKRPTPRSWKAWAVVVHHLGYKDSLYHDGEDDGRLFIYTNKPKTWPEMYRTVDRVVRVTITEVCKAPKGGSK